MSISKEIKKAEKKFKSWVLKRKYKAKNFNKNKKLILFFVPNDLETISGGILSICTIYKTINELKSTHNSNVVASFLPMIKVNGCKYSKFENEMIIFNFNEISKCFNDINYLEVHIPDYMIPLFKKNNPKYDSFHKWTNKIKYFKINILNQNDLLMPDLVHIKNLKDLTKNITMTVAHEKYATIERRNHYDIPLHLFSPWLSPTPYIFNDFNNKENIIILSPDEIDRVPTGTRITKEQIINKLKEQLPNYKIIIIQNMSYDEYKRAIAKAKFTITFGEGLDGYFVESIFSGSVSFAVYNEFFFKPNFRSLPSVYESFDMLFEKIINDIKYYEDSNKYKNYNKELMEIVSKIYSQKRLEDNIKEYYMGNIDYK